jgi:ATP-dependent Clp protease ATP-binding subunit ClpA
VGYDEAGQLTEKIRRRPYSVVLFDEIEKAHPDVMNILLQILDDGHITDAHGRTVNFENTVIIMTTNAGSDRKDGSLGFNKSINEQGREKALKPLTTFCAGIYKQGGRDSLFQQAQRGKLRRHSEIMMNELKASMAEKGYVLSFDEELLRYLTGKSYSVAYGARNLRRLIQKEVEDAITNVLISSYASPVKYISVTAEGEQVQIVTCK